MVITLLGIFYKKATVTTQVFDQVSTIVGHSGAQELKSMLDGISHQNHTTLFGIVGVIVLIFGATGIFTEIQSSIIISGQLKQSRKEAG